MWWLVLNAGQISYIVAGITVMPHYTITFRAIFEFVVLGVVPGVDYEIDLISALFIWLVFLFFVLILKTENSNGSFRLRHQ